jgi:NTP pyrophosphatase (non-canonical NTP hydrolase)
VSSESTTEKPTTREDTVAIATTMFNDYQLWTERVRNDCSWATTRREVLLYDAVGLTAEAGEVADVIKNATNGRKEFDFKEDLLLECGDTLHYIARTLSDAGLTLQNAAEANIEKLTNRVKYGKGNYGKRS